MPIFPLLAALIRGQIIELTFEILSSKQFVKILFRAPEVVPAIKIDLASDEDSNAKINRAPNSKGWLISEGILILVRSSLRLLIKITAQKIDHLSFPPV